MFVSLTEPPNWSLQIEAQMPASHEKVPLITPQHPQPLSLSLCVCVRRPVSDVFTRLCVEKVLNTNPHL